MLIGINTHPRSRQNRRMFSDATYHAQNSLTTIPSHRHQTRISISCASSCTHYVHAAVTTRRGGRKVQSSLEPWLPDQKEINAPRSTQKKKKEIIVVRFFHLKTTPHTSKRAWQLLPGASICRTSRTKEGAGVQSVGLHTQHRLLLSQMMETTLAQYLRGHS